MGHGDQLLIVDRNYPALSSDSIPWSHIHSSEWNWTMINHDPSLEHGVIPRPDFYNRARAIYAVIHTLDDQPFRQEHISLREPMACRIVVGQLCSEVEEGLWRTP